MFIYYFLFSQKEKASHGSNKNSMIIMSQILTSITITWLYDLSLAIKLLSVRYNKATECI